MFRIRESFHMHPLYARCSNGSFVMLSVFLKCNMTYRNMLHMYLQQRVCTMLLQVRAAWRSS